VLTNENIVGPVWQGWTMTDDLLTRVIWLVIDVVDQRQSRQKTKLII